MPAVPGPGAGVGQVIEGEDRLAGEGGGVDGGSPSIHDVTTASIEALKAATLVPDQSFEVVFECMSSISVLQGDSKSSTSMPAWTQIAQKKKD